MVGWYIGAGINLVGSIMINLGTNIMKLGHNKRAMLDMPESEKPPVTRFKEWQAGTVAFMLGNIANFVSFGFAAQSLLAALGSVQFVSNVFFASFVLKETITMYVIVATACIIGGCLLLVIFGNHSSEEYTVDQLLGLYRQPAYIVYLVMMFVFVLGSYILYLHGKHVSEQKGREHSFWVSILPVSYSIFSALLGTQSVLFSKSLSVLMRSTFSGDNQLGNWYTWITLLCFLITAGFWVTRLNKGLRMFPAMVIVPLMQICWTLFSIVSGMLYFQEYRSFNPQTAKHGPLNAIMFTLGVLVVFVGVFLLTKSARPRKSESDSEDKSAQGQLEMVDNPAYRQDEEGQGPGGGGAGASAAAPGLKVSIPKQVHHVDTDVPQVDKISMDTLKFTSLAASTPHKAPRKAGFNNTQSPSRLPGGGVADGAGERDSQEGPQGERRLPPIDDKEMTGASSMMGTIKKNAKKIQQRLKNDWAVDADDFKTMFGMGSSPMPNLAMLATNKELSQSKARQRELHRHNTSINHTLPSSRFYGGVKGKSEGDPLETRSEAKPGAADKTATQEVPAIVLEAAAAAARITAASQGAPPSIPPQPAPVPLPAASVPMQAPLPPPQSTAAAPPPPLQAAPPALRPSAPSLPGISQYSHPGYPSVAVDHPVANIRVSQGLPSIHAAISGQYPHIPVDLPPMPVHSPARHDHRSGSPVPDIRQVQAIVRSAAAKHFLSHSPPPVVASPALTRGSSPTHRSGEVLLSPQFLQSHLQDAGYAGAPHIADQHVYMQPLLHQPPHTWAQAAMPQGLAVPALSPSVGHARMPAPHLLDPRIPPATDPTPSAMHYVRLSHPGSGAAAGMAFPRVGSLQRDVPVWHGPGLIGVPQYAAPQLVQLPTAWAAPGQPLMSDMPVAGAWTGADGRPLYSEAGALPGFDMLPSAPPMRGSVSSLPRVPSNQNSRAWQ